MLFSMMPEHAIFTDNELISRIVSLTVHQMLLHIYYVITTQDIKFRAGYVSNLALKYDISKKFAEIVGILCVAA